MMGAKGLVPAVAPVDLCTLLFMLSFDADAGRARHGGEDRRGPARQDLGRRAPRGGARRPRARLARRPVRREGGRARAAAPQPGHARTRRWHGSRRPVLAAARRDHPPERAAPPAPRRIIRGLCQNPNALASTLDGACDFCVRNGLTLLDVPRSSRRTSASTASTPPRSRRRRPRPPPPSWRSTPRSSPRRRRGAPRAETAEDVAEEAHHHPAHHEDERLGEDQARHAGEQGGAHAPAARLEQAGVHGRGDAARASPTARSSRWPTHAP